jgi:hypothetical protein
VEDDAAFELVVPPVAVFKLTDPVIIVLPVSVGVGSGFVGTGKGFGVWFAVALAEAVGGFPTSPTDEQKPSRLEATVATDWEPCAASKSAQLETASSKRLGIQTVLL